LHDREIAKRLRSRDRSTLEGVVMYITLTYAAAIVEAFRSKGQAADVEDAFSQTILRFLDRDIPVRSLYSYVPSGPTFEQWLWVVVTRQLRDLQRAAWPVLPALYDPEDKTMREEAPWPATYPMEARQPSPEVVRRAREIREGLSPKEMLVVNGRIAHGDSPDWAKRTAGSRQAKNISLKSGNIRVIFKRICDRLRPGSGVTPRS
jgi:hypothetical protein